MINKVCFDWSVLDRNSLSDFLWMISKQVCNKPLTATQLHKIISQHLKKYIPVKVLKKINYSVPVNTLHIGGAYYIDNDKNHDKPIEVTFFYNSNNKKIKISNSMFRIACICFADILLHEIIHMRQYRRRQFKPLPGYKSAATNTVIRKKQSYLGHTDEIDAYSFNIACDLHDMFYGNRNKIINYLTNQGKQTCNQHIHYWELYLSVFEHDYTHPILNRVRKKIIRYIPYARIGKPYLTKKWINT